ncbi:hypothetical protein [Streptomyces albireticuli]|uniref:C2H2-type domain-containing protein n=1 Tax=Streptomyces albireticuli TaxID=1940 RepID=A0A2A2CZZ7_9ACTN|nr:hypothetical protein [Streptomyces albireticuli]MCD9144488.1 hypothetical protein [Streptomyces albireticuli]MCD9163449.1 hypothetical protein [Streptomyces albireticuli]MCD9193165.1 hypothetical protein [Streptomyces albireticuli]PAU44739.1 hypothetical protein CK936_33305 [Streptomyces albireticuli]
MSEIAGTSNGVRPTAVGHPAAAPGALEAAHESYAFACMRCGHGWEQSYEIQHHTDAEGRPFVVYYADGERVPSPLTHPTCMNCGGHAVRIMRSGQVSRIAGVLHQYSRTTVPATDQAPAGPFHTSGSAPSRRALAKEAGSGEETPRHHWHLSDLLHPFQHRK